MAYVRVYPYFALEEFNGLDPNEDAGDFLDILEKKIAFFLGTRPAGPGDNWGA